MREDERVSPSPLSVSHELDGICDAFEAELQAGGSPQIEEYLGSVGMENRAALLRLLLQIEIELLSRRKALPTLESYQQRFPHHIELIGGVYADRHGRSASVANQTRVAARPSQAASGTGTILNGMSSSDTSQTGVRPAPLIPVTGAPPKQFGRFEIIKILGQGAFGTVYQARDPQLDRSVALKVPRAEMLRREVDRQRFLREARSAGSLRHPNICPVHDVLEQDNLPYIVMEFIDGKPLSAFINPQKPRSGRDAAVIVRKLALALEAAHQIGVIHRDLKPDNIMVDRKTKEPVIMDFGLARRDDDANVSLSGQIMGTPTYMPPEQAKGDTHAIGPGSDIYSLGVILYEMLCGQRPFTGSVAEVLSAILTTEPVPPSQHHAGVDPTLEQICRKAMSKKIEDRFSSMREFADALMAYLKQPSGSLITNVDPLGATQTYVRRLRKTFWEKLPPVTKWTMAGAASIMILIGIVLFFQTDQGTLKVEILDPALTITVKLAGNTITIDKDGKPIKIDVGKHELTVEYEGLKAPVVESFEVKNGKMTALRVTRIDGKVLVLKEGDEMPVASATTVRPDPTPTPIVEKSWALKFEGADHVSIPSLKYNGSTAITFEAIVTPYNAARSAIVANTDDSGLGLFIWDGKFCLDVHNPVVHQRIYADDKPFVNQRTHLAGVFDQKSLRLYVNGKLQTDSKPFEGRHKTSRHPFMVGADPDGNGQADRCFKGLIHAVRISRSARYTEDFRPPFDAFVSDKDTLALLPFSEGTGVDLKDASGNNHVGLIKGPRWTQVPTPLPLTTENLKPGKVLWHDDFKKDRLSEYLYSEDWKVKDGLLVPSDQPMQSKYWKLQLPILISGDVVAEYSVSPQGPSVSDANITLANVQAIYGGDSNKQSWIDTAAPGGELHGQRTANRIPRDKPSTVRFMRIGREVSLVIDGKVVRKERLDASPPYPPGEIGLHRASIGQHTAFSSLTVRRPTEAELQEASSAVVSVKEPPLELPTQWSDADIQAGKIKAPDLSKLTPIWDDDFSTASKSGSGSGNASFTIAPREGKLHFDNKKGSWNWWETLRKIPRKDSYAIRVVGSATSKGTETAGWKLILTDGPGKGVILQFGKDGRFRVFSKSGGDPRTFPPISHPAIKPEPNQNELLVIYRSPRLEIYVNGVAICSPIDWESNLKRAYVSIGISGTTGGHAEYDSLTVWETAQIPTLEQRFAKTSVPSPVTNVPPATPSTPAAPTSTPVEPGELKDLLTRTTAASGKAADDRIVVALRQELSNFRLKHYGTPWAITAAELMSKLRWPIDDFSRDKIDPYELAVAGNGDPTKAPSGLVAIIGDSRLKHAGVVEFVSFSPNGKRIASASQDNSVRIWDTETGRQLHVIDDYPDDVRCVVFSPDGNTLASCGGVRTSKVAETFEIRLWDAVAKKFKPNLKGHTRPVRRVAFSPDGAQLASASYDGTIRIWDLKTGTSTALTGHDGLVLDVAFHPKDSQTLVSAGGDATVRVWDLRTKAEKRRALTGHTVAVPCVRFSPDGTTLATCGDGKDNTIRLWKVNDWSLLHTFKGHTDTVASASFDSEVTTLVSASRDSTIRFWNLKTGKEDASRRKAMTSNSSSEGAYSVEYSPNGKMLVIGGADGGVHLWRSDTLVEQIGITGHRARVVHAAMSLDGSLIASQGLDGSVVSWSTDEAKLIGTLRRWQTLKPRGIQVTPEGRTVIVHYHFRGESVAFLNAQSGKHTRAPFTGLHPEKCVLAPDGKIIAVAEADASTIRIRDVEIGTELYALSKGTAPVHNMRFSPDGNTLAVCYYGGRDVMLWDVSTGREIGFLPKSHSGKVSGIAFSPDGSRLATGSWDHAETIVWDIQSKKPLKQIIPQKIREGTKHIHHVEFSADSKWIFTAEDNGILRQWNAETYELVRSISGRGYDFFLTPEGRHIITTNGLVPFFVIRIADVENTQTATPAAETKPATPSPSGVPSVATSKVSAPPVNATQSGGIAASQPNKAVTKAALPPVVTTSLEPRFEIIWMKNQSGLKWEFESSQTEEELKKQLELKKRAGMIPVSISGYGGPGGDARLCSLWTDGRNDTLVEFNQPRKESQELFDSRPGGYYLAWRNFYRIGKETRTAFVFVNTGSHGGLRTRSNFTREGFQKELDEQKAQMYRPTLLSGFVSGSGAIRYHGQWANDRLPYDYRLDLPRTECEAKLIELTKLGHQLIWLDAYTKDKTRFYSYVTVKPQIPILWEASVEVPASELEALMKKQRSRRFFPSVINVE